MLAQGCAEGATLGKDVFINPERVVSGSDATLSGLFGTVPIHQGSGYAATLGWHTQPLRGWVAYLSKVQQVSPTAGGRP